MRWRGLLVLAAGLLMAASPSAETIARWIPNTPLFVYENFHVEPDAWQLDVCQAFDSREPIDQHISMQACAGPGKTAVLSWCIWKFLACYGGRGEHPKGAAVAVTWDNLRDNLWPELSKWQTRSEYLSTAFTWSKERIVANDHPEDWFFSARSWPKSASPEEQGKTLSGLHGKFILAVIDESGAIPVTVLRAAEQALSTKPTFGKILQAGNPISLEGMLYAAATLLRDQWRVVRVTGDPDDPKRSPRIDLAWAKQQIATYGRDNPWVMSYILGKFPPSSINALLGVEEVEAAMQRHLRSDEYDWAEKRLGVDVARFGDDRTVIFPRQGMAAFKPIIMRTARTTDIAARVARASYKWGADQIFVDDTGHWGHGVIDNLTAAGIPCIPLVYHAPALNPRYRNRRAEFWIEGADAIKRGAVLPFIPEMIPELTTPTYTFVNGVFQLEDKEQIKKRLGRSPDLADAYFETYAIPDMPNEVMARLRQTTHVKHDADPFATAAHDFDPFEGR